MYPTSVPTHSAEIGTSCSTTGAILTTGTGGGPAALDLSPHPPIAAAANTTSRPAPPERTMDARITAYPPRGRSALTARRHPEMTVNEHLVAARVALSMERRSG